MFTKVGAVSAIQTLVGTRIYSTLETAPDERPFIVIRSGVTQRQPDQVDVNAQDVVLWVYDGPGSYTRIDNVINAIKAALDGPVTDPNGIAAQWSGDSVDLSDDAWGVVVRTSTFRCYGKR